MSQYNLHLGKMLTSSGRFIKDRVYSFKANELAALIKLGIAEAYSENTVKPADPVEPIKPAEPAEPVKQEPTTKQTKRTYKRKDLKAEQ